MKYIVDLYVDGFDSVEEEKKAAIEFIKVALDMSSTGVHSVEAYDDNEIVRLGKVIEGLELELADLRKDIRC